MPTRILVAVIAATAFAQTTPEWKDARDLTLEGKAWSDTKAPYDRLPARAEGKVRDAVWTLSRHSPGLCVRFVTDAPEIHARWTTGPNRVQPVMSALAMNGLDLYVRHASGAWHWLGIGRPGEGTSHTAVLIQGMPAGRREYMVYLPLYNSVASFEIGVPQGRTLEKGPQRPAAKSRPILFYGTSITHGVGASRPGMVHPAILGRRFDRPVFNLGFSGNGKMEPELAELLAELDPAVFFLDCVPNMQAAEIAERVVPFVRTLRAKHPDTPIVLAEDRTYPDGFLAPRGEQNKLRRAAYRAAWEKLKAAGVRNIHYIPGEPLLGSDGDATVDGSHPSDLGFHRQAGIYGRVLEPLISKEERRK